MRLEKDLLFADHYKLLRKIGRGGYSEVWLAEDKYTHLQIAIKVYAPEGGMDEQGVETFSAEIAHVYNLNHSNILKPQHFDVWENMPYLVLPFCSNGSCMKWMGKMEEQQVWDLIGQIGSGLLYLHKNNVIHQDIKPDNILVNTQGDYVLTDFGISTHTRSTIRHIESSSEIEDPSAGTRPYMAPERFGKDKTPVKASDIWAFGATIFELMTGEVPFGDGILPGGLLQKNGTQLPDMPYRYSEELRCFVAQMLAVEPWDRPTAEQLVKVATDPEHKLAMNVEYSQPTRRQEPQRTKRLDISKTKSQSSGKKESKPVNTKKRTILWAALGALLLIGSGIGFWLSQRTTYLEVNGEAVRVDEDLMAGGGEFEGKVVTDGKKFVVENVPDWMNVEYPDGGKFVVNYTQNQTKALREATLRVVSGRREVSVNLSQSFKQATYIHVNGKDEITAKCDMNGGSLRYAVTTDGDEWTVLSQPEWCSVTKEDNTLVLSFDANLTENTLEGSAKVRADGHSATVKMSQISKTRYEQDKRARELKAQQEREMEGKAYMNITKVEFENVEGDGTIISGWGKPLVTNKMRYLKPKIYYTSLDDTKSHSIKLSFRIYYPNKDTYSSGTSSPTGYTYDDNVTIVPGSNTLVCSGWGNSDNSRYPAGIGRFEIWFKGKRIYSTNYTIIAANSSSTHSSPSSSSSNSNDIKSWVTHFFGWSSYPFKSTSLTSLNRKFNSEFNVQKSITDNHFGGYINGPSLLTYQCTYVWVGDYSDCKTVSYDFKCSSYVLAQQLFKKLKTFFEQNGATFTKNSDTEYSSHKIIYLNGYSCCWQEVGIESSTNTVYVFCSINK